ncbi:MAG TPA: hypothetical protein VLC51_01165 [Nitrospira sp.]|nr:hypothetical protein [Nitrospira sp.]
MYHHDPQARADKLDGLIQRYRDGTFSTVVFTASLKAMRMTGDEIGELVCQHIFAHQSSLPFKRGDVK